MITREGLLRNKEARIGQLTGLLQAARLAGKTVEILDIPVTLFAIDAEYQTDIRTKRDFSYLTSQWNEAKLMPLIGVPHDEEGLMYIVDGYGRWQASQIVNPEKYTTLRVMVILNAPTEPAERQKFEAEIFAYQNISVAQIKPIHKHGALEILGDKAVLLMNEMQKKYEFTYVNMSGQREGGVIGSYSELYNISKTCGRECLEYIFSVSKAAGLDRKANGYASFIMRGMRDAWKYYPELREETAVFLGQHLRTLDTAHFKAKAISRYSLLDYKMAVSLYMEDLIVDHIAEATHKRKVDGKTVTEIKAA